VAIIKKLHANETKVFLGFVLQIFPYFQRKLLKVAFLDITYIKVINTKQDFEKKSTTLLG